MLDFLKHDRKGDVQPLQHARRSGAGAGLGAREVRLLRHLLPAAHVRGHRGGEGGPGQPVGELPVEWYIKLFLGVHFADNLG